MASHSSAGAKDRKGAGDWKSARERLYCRHGRLFPLRTRNPEHHLPGVPPGIQLARAGAGQVRARLPVLRGIHPRERRRAGRRPGSRPGSASGETMRFLVLSLRLPSLRDSSLGSVQKAIPGLWTSNRPPVGSTPSEPLRSASAKGRNSALDTIGFQCRVSPPLRLPSGVAGEGVKSPGRRFEADRAWMPLSADPESRQRSEGTQRASARGALSFGSFSLGMQRKGTHSPYPGSSHRLQSRPHLSPVVAGFW